MRTKRLFWPARKLTGQRPEQLRECPVSRDIAACAEVVLSLAAMRFGIALGLTFTLRAFGCSGSNDANESRNLDNGIPLCGPTSVLVPLETGNSSPVIMARIDGRAARVLIDTGAEAPIISASWLGVSDGQWLRSHELCFGELCLRGEQVFAQDTEFSRPDVPVKYPVFDAVGSSFLFLRDTAFDFPQSSIVFCR